MNNPIRILFSLAACLVVATDAPRPAIEASQAEGRPQTRVAIVNGQWQINDAITYRGASAVGLLMNVRMVNAVFEDANDQTRPPGFDPDANTAAFIEKIPDYAAHGVRAFTLNLQGGMPNYAGAINSAFNPDGSLRDGYLKRVRRVIEASDRHGVVVILGCYYQMQDQILRDEAAVRAGVVNAARWIRTSGFTNVVLEIANEYGHKGFDHTLLKTDEGQVELIQLAKETAPNLLVSTSGLGNGRLRDAVAAASDFLLPHFNTTLLEEVPERIAALKRFGKPVVCNEDDKAGAQIVEAAELSVASGISWGLMLKEVNQYYPFTYRGAADDPAVYAALKRLTSSPLETPSPYFPPPDSEGGWRSLQEADQVRRVAGVDRARLDEAFEFIKGSSKNGGLLVVRRGWLVYERYFGKGHREATPNLASCGKSVTSIAVCILLAERPELFPDGLEQRIFTPRYLPAETFPLTDPRKADIKLGQLLAMTACIRGNNPVYVRGNPTTIDPAGPDGWQAGVDAVAIGKEDAREGTSRTTTATLWCDPGEGYSYATSSIHLAGLMLRHVTGKELNEYVDERLATPLGWGRWGFGYRGAGQLTRMSGGGGIALRATDMLRFGYLLLHQGRWHGQQLVPAEYVRHAARRSPYNPHYPYSLQFSVNTDGDIRELPRDAFWKSGSGGHAVYVVPSLDLVVWKLGGRDDQYSPSNTGMAPHPEAARSAERREGWKQTVDNETALGRTLQLVIAAVKE